MLLLRKTATLLLLGLALSACESLPSAKKPVEVPGAQLQPAPANVMVQRQPNFRERLLQIFSPSPTTPTK